MIKYIAVITAWLHTFATRMHALALAAKHEALTVEAEAHDLIVAEQAAAIRLMQKELVRLHEVGTEAQASIAAAQSSINNDLRKLVPLK